MQKEWRVREKGSEIITLYNARMMDIGFNGMDAHCGNPFCNWPISADHSKNFTVPEYGDVCRACHDLYTAVSFMNPHLVDRNYFKKLHEQWLQDYKPWTDEQRKDRFGL